MSNYVCTKDALCCQKAIGTKSNDFYSVVFACAYFPQAKVDFEISTQKPQNTETDMHHTQSKKKKVDQTGNGVIKGIDVLHLRQKVGILIHN